MQLNMLESGVNDYITKPFIKESVLRRINNVLEYNNRFRDMMYEYSKIAKKLSTKNSIYDTILIVDDSDLNRAIMRDIFKNDFTVLEATNGEEALIIIQQYNYRVDVILLDLFMPVMDGVEFLNLKKDNEMMADIPVVVITADDTVAQQVNVLELGASDYVVKPIVADILMRRVNNVMESRYQYKKMLKQYYNVVEQTTADPLTHLYSRSTAEEMVMRIIKENPEKCHALIVMDVDDFKELNEEHGHSYGDVVLINLADRMKKFFRTGDVLARATGYQFCMFMQDVPSAKVAENKCQELLNQISKMRIGKKQITVTCSLGIAIAENRPMKFADLYERAEVALLEAKRIGKGQAMLSKGLPLEP
jgi:diguanylate cyclase (GGDEF)-like protein